MIMELAACFMWMPNTPVHHGHWVMGASSILGAGLRSGVRVGCGVWGVGCGVWGTCEQLR